MNDDFHTEAFLYLLKKLDPADHAAFEARLARDPVARAALAECAAIVAQFALESAPAEAMLPADQRATLAAILSHKSTNPEKVPQRLKWPRYFWPMAAAILLGLNLLQLFRSTPPISGQEPMRHRPETSRRIPDNPTTDDPLSVSVAEEMQHLEQLRAEYANLEYAHARLQAEYDKLLHQRALIDQRIGRFAAMELVDSGSYARGERKGLVKIARGLLTEPGIVNLEPGTSPATQQPQNQLLPPSETTLPAQTPSLGQPYAWSVFDEASAQGYLNFYNLPPVEPDRTLQLWVKPAGSTVYQNLGEVPPPASNGSGRVSYTLPGATQPPTEVLVTQEPRNATPSQPSIGTAVVRGP